MIGEATGSRLYRGWLVVLFALAMAVAGWGLGFYGTSVYTAYLGDRLGWPTAAVSAAITAYYITSAVIVAAAGDLYQRLGARRTAAIGLSALGLGAVLIAHVESPWQLIPALALLAVGWATTGGVGVSAVLHPWFQARRGLAMSLALNGASLGGLVVVPAMILAIDTSSFETGVAGTAAAVVLPVLLFAVLALRAPALDDLAPDGDGGVSASRLPGVALAWDDGGSALSWRFLSVVTAFSLGLFVQVGFLVHLIAYLQPVLGADGAALCMAATTSAAVAGRFATGFVVDRLDIRAVSALNFMAQGLVLASMAAAGPGPLSLPLCILFGLTVGNLITFGPLVVGREFPSVRFTRLISFLVASNQTFYAFGPAAVGLLALLSGGYTISIACCAVLQGVAAVVILSGRTLAYGQAPTGAQKPMSTTRSGGV